MDKCSINLHCWYKYHYTHRSFYDADVFFPYNVTEMYFIGYSIHFKLLLFGNGRFFTESAIVSLWLFGPNIIEIHNGHITLCKFKMYKMIIWYIMYCEMFTTTRFVNTVCTSNNYHFVVVMVRKLRLYCHSNSPMYNTVPVTIGTWCPLSPQNSFIL